MNKLEISFNSCVSYNSDDNHLNRNISMTFEIDRDLGPDQIVEEFNNFLYMTGFKTTKTEIVE